MMRRTWYHLLLGSGCEAPHCAEPRADLYPTNGGRNLVRACSRNHAQDAETYLRQMSATDDADEERG